MTAVTPLLASAGTSLVAAGAPDDAAVNYTLVVQLEESEGRPSQLTGQGTIALHNTSSASLSELEIHLYLNAFRNNDSLALRSPFLTGRAARGTREFGRIDITHLRDSRTGSDLAVTFDANDPDRTAARVELLHTVAPGETITLAIAWAATLPHLSQRTGYNRDFLFAGQWFPKLAKLEPDGTWVQFAFHPQAEFYSNFGSYDITIETPSHYVVGATGELVDESVSDSRRIRRYLAQDVHDFAWTAWPQYLTLTQVVGPVTVRILYPPGHEHNAQVTVQTLRDALPLIGHWLGNYPYTSLTVVHPPPFAGGAGGMEYPTLITTGGERLEGALSYGVERVTLHELAHQWFYGLVANNENRWPFLDEGLATYVENRAAEELFTSGLGPLFNRIRTIQQRHRALAFGHDAAIATSARNFSSFGELSALAYDRAALLFETMHRVYGEAFDIALQQYARTYTKRHPTPADLVSVVAAHTSPVAGETLRRGLFKGWVNYKVQAVENVTQPSNANPSVFASRVAVTRQGDLAFPVDIRLEDSSGALSHHQWQGDTDSWTYERQGSTRIVRACVDLQRKVVLEERLGDNCLASPKSTTTRHHWLLQTLLQLLVYLVSW